MGLISYIHRDSFRLHENPSMHPESPARLVAIDRAIAGSSIVDSLIDTLPMAATFSELSRIHSPSYIERIEKLGKLARHGNELIQLDADTFMSPWTLEIAKLAAGASGVAIESLRSDKVVASFVAVRPPGHHAMAGRQMGFCYFNNIALAAVYAREHLGYKRVLIIDWDVHHGNGTQDIFYNDPGVLFISLHQYPHWPYETGWLTEDGKGEGRGYNINIPLPGGTGDTGYLSAWDAIVAPISEEYKPDIILVSAGYDAHERDYMSGQKITTTGFALLSSRLKNLADKLGVKTACFLEGGYHTQALADSVVATLAALAQEGNQANDKTEADKSEKELAPVTADKNPEEVADRIAAVTKHFKQYWSCLR